MGNSGAAQAATVILMTEISGNVYIFAAGVKVVSDCGEGTGVLNISVCVHLCASNTHTLIELVVLNLTVPILSMCRVLAQLVCSALYLVRQPY